MSRPKGWKWSKEVREKMRISSKRSWTPERRKRASEFFKNAFRSGKLVHPMTGHKQSAYQKQRVSEIMKGRIWPAEVRQHLVEYWATLPKEVKQKRLSSLCLVWSRRCKMEAATKRILKTLGIAFVPQEPFGDYIVDFYLPDHHIVIECDEKAHERKVQRIKDQKRDRYLNRKFHLVIVRVQERAPGTLREKITSLLREVGVTL